MDEESEAKVTENGPYNFDPNTLINSFSVLYDEGCCTDVVFICAENVNVKCHKVVLVAVSDYLKSLIQGINDTVYISIPGVTRSQLNVLLTFLYEGECVVSAEELGDLEVIMGLLDINIPNTFISHAEPQVSEVKKQCPSKIDDSSHNSSASIEDGKAVENIATGPSPSGCKESEIPSTAAKTEKLNPLDGGGKREIIPICSNRDEAGNVFDSQDFQDDDVIYVPAKPTEVETLSVSDDESDSYSILDEYEALDHPDFLDSEISTGNNESSEVKGDIVRQNKRDSPCVFHTKRPLKVESCRGEENTCVSNEKENLCPIEHENSKVLSTVDKVTTVAHKESGIIPTAVECCSKSETAVYTSVRCDESDISPSCGQNSKSDTVPIPALCHDSGTVSTSVNCNTSETMITSDKRNRSDVISNSARFNKSETVFASIQNSKLEINQCQKSGTFPSAKPETISTSSQYTESDIVSTSNKAAQLETVSIPSENNQTELVSSSTQCQSNTVSEFVQRNESETNGTCVKDGKLNTASSPAPLFLSIPFQCGGTGIPVQCKKLGTLYLPFSNFSSLPSEKICPILIRDKDDIGLTPSKIQNDDIEREIVVSDSCAEISERKFQSPVDDISCGPVIVSSYAAFQEHNYFHSPAGRSKKRKSNQSEPSTSTCDAQTDPAFPGSRQNNTLHSATADEACLDSEEQTSSSFPTCEDTSYDSFQGEESRSLPPDEASVDFSDKKLTDVPPDDGPCCLRIDQVYSTAAKIKTEPEDFMYDPEDSVTTDTFDNYADFEPIVCKTEKIEDGDEAVTSRTRRAWKRSYVGYYASYPGTEKRRRRYLLDNIQKETLETIFKKKSEISMKEYVNIATEMELPLKFVINWFSYRRSKEDKVDKVEGRHKGRRGSRRKGRGRRVLNKQQRERLEDEYRKCRFPDPDVQDRLAKSLKVSVEFIMNWFTRRRNKDDTGGVQWKGYKVIFNDVLENALEAMYQENKFADKEFQYNLAEKLRLPRIHVLQWFQNRQLADQQDLSSEAPNIQKLEDTTSKNEEGDLKAEVADASSSNQIPSATVPCSSNNDEMPETDVEMDSVKNSSTEMSKNVAVKSIHSSPVSIRTWSKRVSKPHSKKSPDNRYVKGVRFGIESGQRRTLMEAYVLNNFPSKWEQARLAAETGLSPKYVMNWFISKRYRDKRAKGTVGKSEERVEENSGDSTLQSQAPEVAAEDCQPQEPAKDSLPPESAEVPEEEKSLETSKKSDVNSNIKADGSKRGKGRSLVNLEQLTILQAAFLENNTPDEDAMQSLSEKIGQTFRYVKNWFHNRRYREKKGNLTTVIKQEPVEEEPPAMITRRKSVQENNKTEQGDRNVWSETSEFEDDSAHKRPSRRGRSLINDEQFAILEDAFINDKHKNRGYRAKLARDLRLPTKYVHNWFSNRFYKGYKRDIKGLKRRKSKSCDEEVAPVIKSDPDGIHVQVKTEPEESVGNMPEVPTIRVKQEKDLFEPVPVSSDKNLGKIPLSSQPQHKDATLNHLPSPGKQAVIFTCNKDNTSVGTVTVKQEPVSDTDDFCDVDMQQSLLNGALCPMSPDSSSNKRNKCISDKRQRAVLEAVYSDNKFPDTRTCFKLSRELGLPYKFTLRWFVNRRSRDRQNGQVLPPMRRNTLSKYDVLRLNPIPDDDNNKAASNTDQTCEIKTSTSPAEAETVTGKPLGVGSSESQGVQSTSKNEPDTNSKQTVSAPMTPINSTREKRQSSRLVNFPYQCAQCGKRFKQNIDAEAHMLFHGITIKSEPEEPDNTPGSDDEPETFSCFRCMKRFDDCEAFENHIQDHIQDPVRMPF